MLASPKLWTLHHLVQHKLLNLNRLICNFPFQLVVGHDNGNAIFFYRYDCGGIACDRNLCRIDKFSQDPQEAWHAWHGNRQVNRQGLWGDIRTRGPTVLSQLQQCCTFIEAERDRLPKVFIAPSLCYCKSHQRQTGKELLVRG